MEGDAVVPTRTDIEARWTALIEGRAAREDVHEWAEPLMLAAKLDDLMVASALQYLHGFDLTRDHGSLRHGPPGDYIRSISEVADELQRWRRDCHDYDVDPDEYVRKARARARERSEHRDQ